MVSKQETRELCSIVVITATDVVQRNGSDREHAYEESDALHQQRKSSGQYRQEQSSGPEIGRHDDLLKSDNG